MGPSGWRLTCPPRRHPAAGNNPVRQRASWPAHPRCETPVELNDSPARACARAGQCHADRDGSATQGFGRAHSRSEPWVKVVVRHPPANGTRAATRGSRGLGRPRQRPQQVWIGRPVGRPSELDGRGRPHSPVAECPVIDEGVRSEVPHGYRADDVFLGAGGGQAEGRGQIDDPRRDRRDHPDRLGRSVAQIGGLPWLTSRPNATPVDTTTPSMPDCPWLLVKSPQQRGAIGWTAEVWKGRI